MPTRSDLPRTADPFLRAGNRLTPACLATLTTSAEIVSGYELGTTENLTATRQKIQTNRMRRDQSKLSL